MQAVVAVPWKVSGRLRTSCHRQSTEEPHGLWACNGAGGVSLTIKPEKTPGKPLGRRRLPLGQSPELLLFRTGEGPLISMEKAEKQLWVPFPHIDSCFYAGGKNWSYHFRNPVSGRSFLNGQLEESVEECGIGNSSLAKRRFRIARSMPSYFRAEVRCPSRSADGA